MDELRFDAIQNSQITGGIPHAAADEIAPHDDAASDELNGSSFSGGESGWVDELMSHYIPMRAGIFGHDSVEDDDGDMSLTFELGAIGMLLGSVAHEISYQGETFEIDRNVFPDANPWEGTRMQRDSKAILSRLEHMLFAEGDKKLDRNIELIDGIKGQLSDIETIYRRMPCENNRQAIEAMLTEIRADLKTITNNNAGDWQLDRTSQLITRTLGDIYERARRYKHQELEGGGTELKEIPFMSASEVGAEDAKEPKSKPNLEKPFTWGDGAWERVVELGFEKHLDRAVKMLNQRDKRGQFTHEEVVLCNSDIHTVNLEGLDVYKVRIHTNGGVRIFVQVRRGQDGGIREIKIQWAGKKRSEKKDYNKLEKLATDQKAEWEAQDLKEKAKAEEAAKAAKKKTAKQKKAERKAKEKAEEKAAKQKKAEKKAAEKAERSARKSRTNGVRAIMREYITGFDSMNEVQREFVAERLHTEFKDGYLTIHENIDARTGKPYPSAFADTIGMIMEEVVLTHYGENLRDVKVVHPYGYETPVVKRAPEIRSRIPRSLERANVEVDMDAISKAVRENRLRLVLDRAGPKGRHGAVRDRVSEVRDRVSGRTRRLKEKAKGRSKL